MHPLFIAARGLLKSDEEKAAKRVCPTEDHTGPAIVPFVGNLTYHQFSSILAGACALLSTFIVLVLIVMHAINYSNPVQQRQIIRIALLVPYVAFFSDCQARWRWRVLGRVFGLWLRDCAVCILALYVRLDSLTSWWL
jgi:hypothetical protein